MVAGSVARSMSPLPTLDPLPSRSSSIQVLADIDDDDDDDDAAAADDDDYDDDDNDDDNDNDDDDDDNYDDDDDFDDNYDDDFMITSLTKILDDSLQVWRLRAVSNKV